jgi:predicted TIM-barrel fold metal-dependent hydrolase
MTMATPHRVDTHHHIIPPSYLAKERDKVLGVAHALADQLVQWTPARAIEAMDRNGIASAVTSISSPGVWFGEKGRSRAIARECNEYAAQMARDHRGRFGVFAALPLPDVEGCLKEIEYAYEALGVDGIGLMTNYDDRYPGDSAFAPVFDELHRRGAVVYFHPTACSGSKLLPGIPPPPIEFPHDTTRAITSLLVGGTLMRCAGIKWIFSHGGGTLPLLTHRLNGLMRHRPDLAGMLPNGVLPELRTLYYDVVGTANPIAFGAVTKMAGIPRLLFGSDYPFWEPEVTVSTLGEMGLSPADLRAIERDNALKLLPRLPG